MYDIVEPNVPRVRKDLGLRPAYRRSDGTPHYQRRMSIRKALLYAEAIGMDPIDIGV